MIVVVFCGPLREVDMQLQLIFPWKCPLGIMLPRIPLRQIFLPYYEASRGVLVKSILAAITNNFRISNPGMAKGFLGHTAVQCDWRRRRRGLFHRVIQGPRLPPSGSSAVLQGFKVGHWTCSFQPADVWRKRTGGLWERFQRPAF